MIITNSSTDKINCEICSTNKQSKNVIPKNSSSHATKPFEKVNSDLCGPITPPSREGYRYIIDFIDEFSGIGFVYLLKSKDESHIALKQFLADTAPFGKVLHIHTDNGGEFLSQHFKQILLDNSIKHTTSAPRSPHQNGQAERHWRTLTTVARCMLADSNLPKQYWSYAMKYSQYIRNRLIKRDSSIEWGSPTPCES